MSQEGRQIAAEALFTGTMTRTHWICLNLGIGNTVADRLLLLKSDKNI